VRNRASAASQRVSVDGASIPVAQALGRSGEELAATGGEDFELCVCVAPERAAAAEAVGLTWVGEVAAGAADVAWRGAPSGARDWHGFEH